MSKYDRAIQHPKATILKSKFKNCPRVWQTMYSDYIDFLEEYYDDRGYYPYLSKDELRSYISKVERNLKAYLLRKQNNQNNKKGNV